MTPGGRRRRSRRRTSRTWKTWKKKLRWAWFYGLALAIVSTATLCALRGE